jgi:hypothetical protein
MKDLTINQVFRFSHSAAISPFDVYSIHCLYCTGEIPLIQHQIRLPIDNFKKHPLLRKMRKILIKQTSNGVLIGWR